MPRVWSNTAYIDFGSSIVIFMLEFHVLICTTTRRAEFCSAPSKMKKKMNAGIPSMVFNNVAPMVIHSYV